MEERFVVKQERIAEVSRNLFYGFSVIAGFSLLTSKSLAGTALNLVLLSAIALVSAEIGYDLEDDYSKIMGILAVISILTAIFFTSLLSSMLILG